ncbi:MAG: hypothetical protein KBF12_10225 [Sebaldella sp.]|nr:hypothetical protein [Sebaldella sp.]
MKYFNIKEILENPNNFTEELKELELYSKRKHFLAIENHKRKKHSENLIMDLMTTDGHGEVEIDIAIEEYNKFTSKFGNYKLHLE